MGVCDAVACNITTVYLAVIVVVRTYCHASGQVLGGILVALVSFSIVGFILVLALALAWDLASKVVTRVQERDSCRGGICWHGVAARSPVSRVQFRRLPDQNQ